MIKSRQGSLRLAHAQRAIAFEMLIRTAMAPCFILLLFVVFCSNTAVHGAALKTDDHQASMMVEFNCPPLPPLARPASNVYELKPQDIKVVMALGDSITAGFGMMGVHYWNLFENLNEYRGKSWSIGGDQNASTIATFLQHYTPDLIGASLGQHLVELCYGDLCPPFQYRPEKDMFNAAQTAALLPNLVSHEFNYLLKQLQNNPNVNMEKDWKMLTILVGFNDLCLGCSGKFPYLTPDDFERNLRDTIENVRKEIPRVFVNVVEIFNLSLVYNVSQQAKNCELIHNVFFIECLCLFAHGDIGEKTRRKVDDLVAEYNGRMRKVAADYAKKYNNFAVVVQPGFKDGTPQDVPLEFLSNLDCFHPSLIGHQNMAKVIWNNILSPAAQKKTTFDYRQSLICPNNDTLLYTY